MNETDAMINSALVNAVAVTSLIAETAAGAPAVFSWQAVDNQEYPFIVFNDMSDTEENDTAHELHDMIYQVRAFTKQSMKAAKAIDYQIRLLLDNAALTASGFAVLKCARIGSVRFVENQVSTDKVFSAGGLYRIRIEKTS